MKVIAIDMDGTAMADPKEVCKLHDDKDNLIVIYTARPECMRQQTVDELARMCVPYHALVMGKLRADVYIDDKNQGGLQWP